MSQRTIASPVRKRPWTVAGITIPRPPDQFFSLSPHGSGKWQKKVAGKYRYFGNWARLVNGKLTPLTDWGWREAWDAFKVLARKLSDGLDPDQPPPHPDNGPTVGFLCNEFEIDARERVGEGTLSPRMFTEYESTTDRLVAKFGGTRPVADLKPDDFTALGRDLRAQFGPVRLGNEIQRVRTIFKWGREAGKIPAVPAYGTRFDKPSKRELRLHREAQGPRSYTADECRRFLGLTPYAPVASPTLTAMVWVGLNCGFGNDDVARLTLSAVDVDGGWLTQYRHKTGLGRRAKLWPESVAAIRAALEARPEPADKKYAGHVFLRPDGKPWVANDVSHRFGKLAKKLDINGHRNFYSLRHTFRTIADATLDPVAVRTFMGHADNTIDANYRDYIFDSRLERVAAFVRGWLVGETKGGAS